MHRLKNCEYRNNDEDNSLNNLKDSIIKLHHRKSDKCSIMIQYFLQTLTITLYSKIFSDYNCDTSSYFLKTHFTAELRDFVSEEGIKKERKRKKETKKETEKNEKK